jgi:hypothetical protein
MWCDQIVSLTGIHSLVIGHFSLFAPVPTFGSEEPLEGSFSDNAISVSWNLTVLSPDPETMRLPSGENATDVT